MAGQDREPSARLKSELLSGGNAFSFFQVMRLLRLLDRDSVEVGGLGPVEKENVRLKADLSLAFPATDVAGVESHGGATPRYEIMSTFLSLYGVSSPLPTFYTEDLLDEASEDESVGRDLLDVFNHRILSLFYRCLTKYRLFFQATEAGNQSYQEKLFSLFGLGEKKLRDDFTHSDILLRYTGLLTQYPRSSVGLQTLLKDALQGPPVKIIPCLLRKVKIPPDQRFYTGMSGNALGIDSFVGEQMEDRMGKFRIRIGPVNRSDFQRFLPGSDGFEKAVSLTRLYVLDPLVFDLELIMEKDQVQTVCLGVYDRSRLGLNSWIYSGGRYGEVGMVFEPGASSQRSSKGDST